MISWFDPLALMLYLMFCLLILLPLLLVLGQAVMPGIFQLPVADFSFSLEPFTRAFSRSRVVMTLLHSLELSAAGALSATMLGGIFAVLLQRIAVPQRRFLAIVPWVVFMTPSYLKGLAWVLLLSPEGYLIQLGLVTHEGANAFFSLPGLIVVQALGLFPLPAFIIGGALRGLGGEYQDAARMAGASGWRIWTRINLPLLLPAIALSLIASFAEMLSDFGMATTIARSARFELLTYGIYTAASDYPVDFPLAGTLALMLLALVMMAVLADRLLRRRQDPKLISGRSRPARLYQGRWRWLAFAITVLILFFSAVLPLVAIVLRALTATLAGGLSPANFTLAHLKAVLTPTSQTDMALMRSLVYASITAGIASLAALFLAVAVDRSRNVLRPLVLTISLGAVAVPGIVLAFGYILLWNRLPVFRDWPFPHYGDASLLITGYVAAALPYCLVLILAAIGQLSPGLGDAARLAGANRWQRLFGITFPLVFLSIATAFIFTFIRTVFELPMSQLLVPQTGPPMPPLAVGLFDHDQDGLGSALSLLTILIAGVLAGAMWFISRSFAPNGASLPGVKS
ncbi:ABC transporter permease subunit [Allorhizobium sp. BGMRC 0089]|uniref:ABC transporter permease n=1 Tax=Allorhizobium sonneratiae TaxID=2934936 RepID=UPI00203329A7|nr:ABC transporter permease subunit [Allorhizobium sonneratiae]MCM2294667.1 ABC transporter permease subunit [Allorhizobium sonneratiae]